MNVNTILNNTNSIAILQIFSTFALLKSIDKFSNLENFISRHEV